MIYKGKKETKLRADHAGPVYTLSEKFESATKTCYFGFVIEENSARKITSLS